MGMADQEIVSGDARQGKRPVSAADTSGKPFQLIWIKLALPDGKDFPSGFAKSPDIP
jgi:hypothetical protein